MTSPIMQTNITAEIAPIIGLFSTFPSSMTLGACVACSISGP